MPIPEIMTNGVINLIFAFFILFDTSTINFAKEIQNIGITGIR